MAPYPHDNLRFPAWSSKNDQDGSTHISYELPHRLNHAALYPVVSSNGSSIFIYSHHKGLTIIWRGGRPIKSQPSSTRHEPFSTSDAMIVDFEDDDPITLPEVEFEETSTGAGPISPIVASVDIALGTAVLDFDFPALPSNIATQTNRSIPSLFRRRIIVTTVCADGQTRIVAVPLTPQAVSLNVNLVSSPRSHNIEICQLGGSDSFKARYPTAVSTTFVSRRPNSRTKHDETKFADESDDDWILFIATLVQAPLTRLKITVVPIVTGHDSIAGLDLPNGRSLTSLLSHQVVTLVFAPSHSPFARKARLLISDTSGAVRFADVDHRFEDLGSSALSWLGTLHVPFRQRASSEMSSSGRRCRILDARWVLQGKAVIVLLDDGQWGIWDLEGAGPAPPEAAASMALRGIVGGVTARFSLYGFLSHRLEPPTNFTSKLTLRSKGAPATHEVSTLAPMTPQTRKVREQTLFNDGVSGRPAKVPRNVSVSGGICVAAADTAFQEGPDESIVFWYSSDVFVIPSLMQQWRRAINNTSKWPLQHSATGAYVGDVTHIPVSSAGLSETIVRISQLEPNRIVSDSSARMSCDLALALEHRITIICTEKQRPQSAHELRDLFKQSVAYTGRDHDTETEDQDMLRHGELDLGGMKRLLDVMSAPVEDVQAASGNVPRARRVGFAN